MRLAEGDDTLRGLFIRVAQARPRKKGVQATPISLCWCAPRFLIYEGCLVLPVTARRSGQGGTNMGMRRVAFTSLSALSV